MVESLSLQYHTAAAARQTGVEPWSSNHPPEPARPHASIPEHSRAFMATDIRATPPSRQRPAALDSATRPAAGDRIEIRAADRPVPGAADEPPARDSGGQGCPVRVKRPEAARRIRELADIASAWSVRDRLRRLADRVRAGAGNPQRTQFVEATIADCLDEVVPAAATPDRWLACEAATWALGWLARARRAGGSAGRLLERLVQEATEALPLFAAGDTRPARFALMLGRLFADVEACRRFERVAAGAVAAEIDRLVSPQGIVSVLGSEAMVDRVVRWCRVRELADRTGEPAWGSATDRRWREATTAAVRLLGRHGRLITATGLLPVVFTRPLLEAAVDLGKSPRRTAAAVQASRPGGSPRGCLRRDLHDEEAAVAVLRSGWDAGSVRVLVDYRRPLPHLEVAVNDRLLVAGPWAWSLSADGRPLEAEGPWTKSCWESDGKASFLEITAALPGGRQLERQVTLLPRERILLLADAVTTPGEAASPATDPAGHQGQGIVHREDGLRYEATLPLTAGLETETAAETREVTVFDTTMRCLALPLALPEWRTAGRGSFAAEPAGLRVVHETAGPRLFCPLWLDLDPARIGLPLTWRQLTVADTRLILPPHQAAGFRVQAGLEQWLVYRTLDAPRNRTLLGCNVSCEYLVGRVKRSGEVRRLLEIQ